MTPRLLLPVLLALGCNDQPAEGTFVGNPGKMDVSAAPTSGVQMRSGSGTVDALSLVSCDGERTSVALGADVATLSFEGLFATTDPPLRLPGGTWCGLEMSLGTLSFVAASDLGEAELDYADLVVTMSGGELAIGDQTYGLQLAHPEWLDLLRRHAPLTDEHRAEIRARIERSSGLVVASEGSETPVDGEGPIAPEALVWAGDDRPATETTEPTDTADTAEPTETADTAEPTPTADTGLTARVTSIDWDIDPVTVADGGPPSVTVPAASATPVLAHDSLQSALLFQPGPPWVGTGSFELPLQGAAPSIAEGPDGVLLTYDAGQSTPGLALLGLDGDVQAEANWQALTGTASGAMAVEASGIVFASWLQVGIDGTRSAVLQAFDDQLQEQAEALVVGSSVVDPPHLAAGPDGSIGIVWTETAPSPFGIDSHEIWARRYAPQGTAATFRVDTRGSVTSRDADLTLGDSGMVATWIDEGMLFARAFDPLGAPLSEEIELGDGTAPPTSVWVADDLVVVVWGSDDGVHVVTLDPQTGLVDGEPAVLPAQLDTLSEVAVGVYPQPTPQQTRLTVAWSDGDLGGYGTVWWGEIMVAVEAGP